MHPWGCTLGERLDRYYLANTVGNPVETTVALSHLIFSGLLDRHPGLLRRGIRVNTIHPGFIETPLGRVGRPDEVAELVCFLLSDALRAAARRSPTVGPVSALSGTSQETTQEQISGEMAAIGQAYADAGVVETQPRLDYPPYRSSLLRHPTKSPRQADPEAVERWAPCFGHRDVGALEADLTIQHDGEPIGERMVVTGRITDGEGRPVRSQLVEIWQANAGGRYLHQRDQHPAPLDPHFTGVGRCLTDADGGYRFVTIKPGPYPWKNHRNAWRPAHIHFSLFGTDFTSRLVTQMYFPGDPLFALDPIYQSIVDPQARDRLVARYDHDVSRPEWSTGYRFDIVLTGRRRTQLDDPEDTP